MTAEDFYDKSKRFNKLGFYDSGTKLFFEGDLFQFAEAYAKQQNKQLTAALELALEALKDAHVMGDFSDDIEAIKEVLNKEQ